MDDPIQVGPQQETDAVEIGNTPPMVSPDIVAPLALHYHHILGEQSPGAENIQALIASGREQDFRRQLTIAEQRRLLSQRDALARQFMAARPAGTPIDPDELDYIMRLSSGELATLGAGDPSTILERIAAARTNAIATARPSEARTEVGESTAAMIEAGAQRYQTLHEYASNRLNQLVARAAAQGWGEYSADMIGLLASPLQWYRQQNVMTRGSQFMLGSNVEDQANWYYSNPNTQESMQALDRAVEELEGTNLQNAIQYLTQIVRMDNFTRNMQNLGAFLDVAPGVGWIPYAAVGYGAYRGARSLAGRGAARPTTDAAAREAVQDAVTRPSPDVASAIPDPSVSPYSQAIRDTVEAAVRNRGLGPAPVIEASGDLTAAARYTARDQLISLAERTHAGGATGEALGDFRGYARSFFNPDSIYERGTRLSNEAAQRIRVALNNQAEGLADSIFNRPLSVDRLGRGTLAENAAAAETWRLAVNEQYTHIADRILDVRFNMPRLFNELPPGLRKTAEDLFKAELRINQAGRIPGLRTYMDAVYGLDNVIARLQQLAAQSGIKRPSAVKPDKAEGFFKRMERRFRGTPDDAGKGQSWRTAMDASRLREMEEEVAALATQGRQFKATIDGIPENERILYQNYRLASENHSTAELRIRDAQGTPTREFPRPSGFVDNRFTDPRGMEITTGAGNVKYISIPFGNHLGELYPTASQASIAARHELGLKNYSVRQQGSGYYIEVLKALDETNPYVRFQLGLDTAGTTPRPYLPDRVSNYLFRGGNRAVSKEIATDTKIAAYSTSNMYEQVARLVRETMLDKAGMSKAERNQFYNFIEHERVDRDPISHIPGRFSNDQMELETRWQSRFGTYPSERQSLAYWSSRQVYDTDKLMLDFSIYRDKARTGMENHTVTLLGQSIELEGKLLTAIPVEEARSARAGFLVWDTNPDNLQHIYINRRGGLDAIESYQNQGYRVIQISHFAERAMMDNPRIIARMDDISAQMGFATRPGVDFVLVRDFTSAPLPLQQTPNRAGFHHQYAFESLLRQPDIRNNRYYGDMTLRGFARNADGEYFLPRYEQARRIMNEVDNSMGRIPESALADFLKRNLPESVQEFRALFNPNRFNRNTPFYLTRSGENVWRAHKLSSSYPGIENILDSPLNLYNTSTLRYALERGETPLTVARRGTTENPVFHLAPAPMVDALPTMDRAMRHLIRNRNISDLQIKATERYIAEFQHVLQGETKELYRNPLDTLINGKFREGVDARELAAASNYRRTMMENLGIQTDTERVASWIRQKSSDYLYRAVGAKPLDLAEQRLPNGLLNFIKHPVAATKHGVGYYMLTNPIQVWVQAAGVAHVFALTNWAVASRAMAATTFGRYIRDYTGSTGLRAHMIAAAERMGIKREHFSEAYDAGTRTGFFNVGREHALTDRLHATNVTMNRSGTQKVLDVGMSPMRKGEEFLRHNSWWAAYLQWRDANPRAILDDLVIGRLLNEADRYSGWMSSFGKTSAEKGVLGIPAQFWSYNMRIMEQLWDIGPNKLTWWQFSKVLFNYSLFFGAPAAAGVLLPLPLMDMARRYLLEQYTKPETGPNARSTMGDLAMRLDENEGWAGLAFEVLMNGALQAGLNRATGINVGVSQRYAPGSRFIADVLGDRTMVELLSGATGSVLRDLYLASNPFLVWMMDSFRDANSRHGQRIEHEDWLGLAQALGGRLVNTGIRDFYALAYYEYRNNRGQTVDRLSGGEAAVFAAFGLAPDRINDVYGVLRNEEALRIHQADITRQIQQNFRNMVRAVQADNIEEGLRLQRRNQVLISIGRFRPDQVNVLVNRLARDHGSLIENTFSRWGRQSPDQARFYQRYNRALEGQR